MYFSFSFSFSSSSSVILLLSGAMLITNSCCNPIHTSYYWREADKEARNNQSTQKSLSRFHTRSIHNNIWPTFLFGFIFLACFVTRFDFQPLSSCSLPFLFWFLLRFSTLMSVFLSVPPLLTGRGFSSLSSDVYSDSVTFFVHSCSLLLLSLLTVFWYLFSSLKLLSLLSIWSVWISVFVSFFGSPLFLFSLLSVTPLHFFCTSFCNPFPHHSYRIAQPIWF